MIKISHLRTKLLLYCGSWLAKFSGLRIRIRIRTFLVGSGSGKFSPDLYLDPDPIGTLAM